MICWCFVTSCTSPTVSSTVPSLFSSELSSFSIRLWYLRTKQCNFLISGWNFNHDVDFICQHDLSFKTFVLTLINTYDLSNKRISSLQIFREIISILIVCFKHVLTKQNQISAILNNNSLCTFIKILRHQKSFVLCQKPYTSSFSSIDSFYNLHNIIDWNTSSLRI